MNTIIFEPESNLYIDGWRVAAIVNRNVPMQELSLLLKRLWPNNHVDNLGIPCKFTISNHCDWLLCFQTEEDMFLGLMSIDIFL